MYTLISLINSSIREEIMPNPFEFVSDNELIVILFTYFIGSMIVHVISFLMCGVFYNRWEAPVLGSIGYMIAFSYNVWILINISKLFNSFFIISIIYFIAVIFTFVVLNKIKDVLVCT